LGITLQEAVGDTPAVVLKYGNFLQTVFDFVIVAFAIFMAIKAMNSAKRKEEDSPDEPPKPSNEEVLLTEIRDALRK
ncbi:MAG: MscL family protein, partial [Methylococcaceae bacterium]